MKKKNGLLERKKNPNYFNTFLRRNIGNAKAEQNPYGVFSDIY